MCEDGKGKNKFILQDMWDFGSDVDSGNGKECEGGRGKKFIPQDMWDFGSDMNSSDENGKEVGDDDKARDEVDVEQF